MSLEPAAGDGRRPLLDGMGEGHGRIGLQLAQMGRWYDGLERPRREAA